MKKLLYVALSFLVLPACVPLQSDDGGGSPAPNPACTATQAEISECSSGTTYSSGVTITGNAKFNKRTIVADSGGLVLGNATDIQLPIKFAEVRVLNSSGTVVQCGKTDALGDLKAVDGTSALKIPNAVGNYTVQVLSRANSNIDVSGTPGKPAFKLYASVKKDICTNSVHSIEATISSSGSGTVAVGTSALVATADESTSSAIPGGAFNIFNDLVTTFEYIGANTGTQDLSCLSPKLHVYWQSGFNPAQYIYPDEDPEDVPNVSFYLRGYAELYINGGKLGNVKQADTDHFDDAVIIHELGHRIEDACGKMESPGGSHNGLFRIDPRLAWSEGWGNFMGANVVRNNFDKIYNNNAAVRTAISGVSSPSSTEWQYYLDTSGYKGSFGTVAQELIRFDMTKAGNDPEVVGGFGGDIYYYDKVDASTNPGEGHFREVSIARSLFKITNTCDLCTDENYFSQIWGAFREMANDSFPFRSSARFYDRLQKGSNSFGGSFPAATTGVSIDSTLSNDEAQQVSDSPNYIVNSKLTWPAYGTKLVPQSGASQLAACGVELEIWPRREPATTEITGNSSAGGDDQREDQRFSNHFYYIDKTTSLGSATSITLTSTWQAGDHVDFDLVLLQSGYSYPDDPCTAYNTNGYCTTYSKTNSSQFIRAARTNNPSSAGPANITKSETISSLNGLSTTTPYILDIRAFTAGKTISNSTQYTYELKTNTGEYLCPATTF